MQVLGAAGYAFPENGWIILLVILLLLCVALVPMRKSAVKRARSKRAQIHQQGG